MNNLKALLSLVSSMNKKPSKKKKKTNKFKLPFSMSSGPIKYGPGRNISVVNSIRDIPGTSLTRIPLQTILLSNSEFTAKKSFFRYFKILEVRLCLFPSGLPTASFIYCNLSWNAIQYTENDIRQDDSTKIAPAYRTENKIFRWLPIKSVINVNSISQEIPTNFLNVSEYISTDRVVSLPGWLYILNAGDTGNACNIEVRIQFRANDFGDQAKKKLEGEEMFKEKVIKISPEQKEN